MYRPLVITLGALLVLPLGTGHAAGPPAHLTAAADPPNPAQGAGSAQPAQSPAQPAPGDAAADLRMALERLSRQEEELKQLREALAADRAERKQRDAAVEEEQKRLQAQLKEATTSAADALRKSLFPVRGAHLQLSLSGFVQFDFAMRQSSLNELNPATGEPLNQDGFGLRRGRLTLGADYGIVGGNLTVDGNTLRGPTIRILGGEVSLRWPTPDKRPLPLIQASFGSFKNPFGYEIYQESDTQRLFVERSAVGRALFPGEYDVGFRLQGGWRFLRYAFAIMNGEPIGERSFPQRDPNRAKDYLGRLGIDTNVLPWFHVSGGVSGLRGTGFNPGAPATKDVLTWRDLNENGAVDPGEIQVIPGAAAVAASNFGRFAFGGDVQLGFRLPKVGELAVYGELIYASNLDRGLQPANPVTAARNLRELGGYIGVKQELGRWGQVGVRYDRYNPDLDSTDRQAGVLVPRDATFSTVSFAGAVRLRSVARFIVEYDINRNPLGRDSQGRPATLRDNALTLRAEVVF